MSPLFASRQRAEDFAARLEGTFSGPVAATGVGAAHQTDELVDVVAALRQHAEHDVQARPRPAFADALRDRLVAEAEAMGRQVLTAPTRHPSPPVLSDLPGRPHRVRERLTVVGATAAIIIGGTVGVGNAAEGALPGQALYSIKRSIEAVDAQLADSPSAHGRVLLAQASIRLTEVKGLDAEGPLERQLIPATLDEFSRQAHAGAQLLMQEYRQTADPRSIEEVRAFAADQLPVLRTLSTSTSDGAQPQLSDAAAALRTIDSDATQECADCSDRNPLDSSLTSTSQDGGAGHSSTTTGDDARTGGESAGNATSDGSSTEGSPSDVTKSTDTAANGDVVADPAYPGSPLTTPAAPGQPAASGGAQPATGVGTGSTGVASTPGDTTPGATAPGSMGPGAVPTIGGTTVTSVPPRVPLNTLPSIGSSPSAGATATGVGVAPAPAPAQPGTPTSSASSASAAPSGTSSGTSSGSGTSTGFSGSGTTTSGTTSSGTSGTITTSSGTSGTITSPGSGSSSTSGSGTSGTSGSGTSGSGTSASSTGGAGTDQVTATESSVSGTAADTSSTSAHDAHRKAVRRHITRPTGASESALHLRRPSGE